MKLILFFLSFFPLYNYVKAGDGIKTEWCRAAPVVGLPDYAECRPESQAAKYMIHVVPIVAPGIDLESDVKLTIFGSDGDQTAPIIISSQTGGTTKQVTAEREDVGTPSRIKLKMGTNKQWKCQRITIWKGYRYWIFDCHGILSRSNPEATFDMSGNKLYELTIQTGSDEQAGTKGGIEISLIGDSGETGSKLVHQGMTPGGQAKLRFRGADVGKLQEIVLTNTANSDPWYCVFVRIRADDGTVTQFSVRRWIGQPYETTVEVSLNPSQIADLPAQDVDCHTRGNDLIATNPKSLTTVKLRCPYNCAADEFSRVLGTSIHPGHSSICSSAISDGVLSPSGGEVLITATEQLSSYYGHDQPLNGVMASDYEASPTQPTFSYYTYPVDRIDDIKSNVRVVDAYGKLQVTGRLETRRNGVWGSVCKKGDFAEFNEASAESACKTVGFLHGVLLESCLSVDGQNVCASQGYPVSAGGVQCNGKENSFADCTYEEPIQLCEDHTNDVAVQCTNYPPDRTPSVGTVRVVDSTGAPAKNGMGRLEFFDGATWGTICSEGWTIDSERVACLEMGYSGLSNGGASKDVCSDMKGQNFCGPTTHKIAATEVTCEGTEENLRRCPHRTSEDIYCVHDEDVIVACEGPGDPSGVGMFKQESMDVPFRKFHPIFELKCSDRAINTEGMTGLPGTTFVVECPEGCAEEPSAITGTHIYTDSSPICKVAIHAGVIDNQGGKAIVILGHGQKSYMGSERNGVVSDEQGPYARSILVSRAVSSVLARTAAKKSGEDEKFAGSSTFNGGEISSGFEVVSFLQKSEENIPNENLPPAQFAWNEPTDWPGFRGAEKKDFVDCSSYPGGETLNSLNDFTISVQIKVGGGAGTWRTVIAHSECKGFSLSVNTDNELIFEQACTSFSLNSGFKPVLGEWFHAAVTYSSRDGSVSLYVNGQLAQSGRNDEKFSLITRMTIGRSSDGESSFFIGRITGVVVYDQTLSAQHVLALKDALPVAAQSSGPKRRKTVDGRECSTPCSEKSPVVIVEETHQMTATNAATPIACDQTLKSEIFNGPTQKQIRVSCSEGCLRSKTYKLKGYMLYTEDSSICAAALQLGIIDDSGEDVIVTLRKGISQYIGRKGNHEIISADESHPQLRSFTVSKANRVKSLSCQDDAMFTMQLKDNERGLVTCPSRCFIQGAHVIGGKDGFYAPTSIFCAAAMHAGAISVEGGQVEFQVTGGRRAYHGSNANGIQSENGSGFLRSFKFAKQHKESCFPQHFDRESSFTDFKQIFSDLETVERETHGYDISTGPAGNTGSVVAIKGRTCNAEGNKRFLMVKHFNCGSYTLSTSFYLTNAGETYFIFGFKDTQNYLEVEISTLGSGEGKFQTKKVVMGEQTPLGDPIPFHFKFNTWHKITIDASSIKGLKIWCSETGSSVVTKIMQLQTTQEKGLVGNVGIAVCSAPETGE